MIENDQLNPIACEPCRQKKCKCDRNLPVCSQCSPDSSKCSYPESGKRGLPLGYLNQLETRLAETETALFQALSTLHSNTGNGTEALVRASPKADAGLKQKAGRIAEWSRLPLAEWVDMDRWWLAKREQFTVMASDNNALSDGTSHESSGSSDGRTRTGQRNDGPMHVFKPSSADTSRPAISPYLQETSPLSAELPSTDKSLDRGRMLAADVGDVGHGDAAGRNAGTSARNGQSSKAGRLSQDHPSIYF